MAQRKLKVENVEVKNLESDANGKYAIVTIQFNRHLSPLEASGVRAVLDGEIK